MARPSFKPTASMRRMVSIAAGGGMPHEQIAIGLGISRNTLEKHFQSELSVGAYKRRLEVLSAMHTAARKGNVSAQRAYMTLDPKLAAPPAPAGQPDAGKVGKEPPLGKKEQAQADAVVAQVGTEWAELLPSGTSVQ